MPDISRLLELLELVASDKTYRRVLDAIGGGLRRAIDSELTRASPRVLASATSWVEPPALVENLLGHRRSCLPRALA